VNASSAIGPIRSGELARLAGVSADTLRHYERKGLLTSRRSPNGYRAYAPEALARVRLVRRALSVGFTLDELVRILRIRDRGGAPCREVRALAASKLESMEAQIRELKLLRRQLRALLENWDVRLAKTPRGKQARLLDGWAEMESEPSMMRARVSPPWNNRRGRLLPSHRKERK